MATTPARITPQGPSASAPTPEAVTRDTERPPRDAAFGEPTTVGPSPDPASLAALRVGPPTPRNLRAAPPVEPAPASSAPVEATEVGPAPDPAASVGALPVGPPTPKNLKAAPPVTPGAPLPPPSTPKLAAAPLSAPQRPPGTTAPRVPLPFDPAVTQRPGNVAPPPRSSRGVGATAIGLAPAPDASEGHADLATRAFGSMASDKPLTRRCTSCETLYPADFLICPRDATPLVAVDGEGGEDPLVGALVGDTYQIVRVLGEGGMGRVYEARHLRLKERRFAIKCLHADLARNAEMAARFLREAEAASSIKHENVVDVFDVHHLPDGTPYFVGEYLEGEELADYVKKRGPLEPRMAAKVTRQVCSALAAAHARGIVHRDMKPENIFVLASSIEAVERGESRTLRVKVLDFGISKVGHGDGTHLTRTGVIMGTPSYMAPEQARGRPVDHRADVYAVGACLYFMVTGRRPFDSDDPTSTLSMVLTEDPIRPREIDSSIPEMLELVIQRAMAKDASDRYATIGDLDKALAMFTGRSSGLALASGGAMAPVQVPVVSDPRAGGASRALDVAKALLGSESTAPPGQQSHLARTARPTIVIASLALGAWLVGGTVAALAGLVRVLHEGEVTLTESLLLVVGCLFAAATPIALYVIHLRKVVWPNSVRAVQLATDLKRLAVAALVTYGALSILGRIAHTVFLRSSEGLASGVWDIALFVVSVVGALSIGGVGPLLRTLRRRRSSKE